MTSADENARDEVPGLLEVLAQVLDPCSLPGSLACWRVIIAPSEKRIRTLIQAVDARRLDELTGDWLRALAQAGRLENLLTAIAIDGKWLRGIGGGQQVKLSAEMLHEQKVIIAQHAIPENTNQITRSGTYWTW